MAPYDVGFTLPQKILEYNNLFLLEQYFRNIPGRRGHLSCPFHGMAGQPVPVMFLTAS